jgi:hypothetical protein
MQVVYLQNVPIKVHTICNRVLIVGIPPLQGHDTHYWLVFNLKLKGDIVENIMHSAIQSTGAFINPDQNTRFP